MKKGLILALVLMASLSHADITAVYPTPVPTNYGVTAYAVPAPEPVSHPSHLTKWDWIWLGVVVVVGAVFGHMAVVSVQQHPV